MKQVADLKKAGTLTQYKARVFKAKPQATAAPAPLVMPEPTKVAAPAQPITGHVTTERTGKQHKENMIYAWLITLVGFIGFFAAISGGMQSDTGPTVGAISSLVMIGGLIWLYVIKWQVWWHHG
jgi:hypothetical protein